MCVGVVRRRVRKAGCQSIKAEVRYLSVA